MGEIVLTTLWLLFGPLGQTGPEALAGPGWVHEGIYYNAKNCKERRIEIKKDIGIVEARCLPLGMSPGKLAVQKGRQL